MKINHNLFCILLDLHYLCFLNKVRAMEGKRYPVIEENVDVVSGPILEPVTDMVAPMSRPDVVSDEEDVDIDDLDWSRLPSLGPFSEEEAIARIDEAEAELDDPTKWISSENAWAYLYSKYPWLR